MEEFAKMIYEQWCKENDDRDAYHEEGKKMLDRLEQILSVSLFNELYEVFCENSFEIEETAFIAGFAYACKCLSNGRIELGGVKE